MEGGNWCPLITRQETNNVPINSIAPCGVQLEQTGPYAEKKRIWENFFRKSTQKNIDGRFIVKLQFTKDPRSRLVNTVQLAINQFLCFENQQHHNQVVKREYRDCMKKLENLGYIKRIAKSSVGKKNYFLQHRVENVAGQCRVIFDGSVKNELDWSLNEILNDGAMLQTNLWSLMVRFRKYKCALSSNIGDIFNQINVHPKMATHCMA